jgi:hypothetical protein
MTLISSWSRATSVLLRSRNPQQNSVYGRWMSGLACFLGMSRLFDCFAMIIVWSKNPCGSTCNPTRKLMRPTIGQPFKPRINDALVEHHHPHCRSGIDMLNTTVAVAVKPTTTMTGFGNLSGPNQINGTLVFVFTSTGMFVVPTRVRVLVATSSS